MSNLVALDAKDAPALDAPRLDGLPTSSPDWLAARDFPFPSRFVDAGGVRFHYVDEGEGPVVLLVHGSPMWSFMYRKVILRLREHHRVVAVDLPGLGLSSAPLVPGAAFSTAATALTELVRRLDLWDVSLVVHATSAPSALAMAFRVRERIRALVISNAFAWPLDRPAKFRLIVRVVSSRWFSALIVRANLLPWLTARLGRRTGPFSAAERRAILGPYRAESARRHLANILASIPREHEFLAKVERRMSALKSLPTLLLYGAHDNGYRAGFVERWRTLLPESQVVVLERAGHFPAEDAPEAFGDALERFVGGATAPAPEPLLEGRLVPPTRSVGAASRVR